MSDTTLPGVESHSRAWRAAVRMDADHAKTTERMVTLVWGLLFFNVIEASSKSAVLPLPHTIEKILTQGALVPALLLAYTINKRLTFRRNAFLSVATVLVLGALASSIAFGTFHADLRALRFLALVLVLWLLTPWWGRDDMIIAKVHLRCLEILLGSVLLGLLVAPGHAFLRHRLSDVIWPIASTQVAHYAAVTCGIVGILFLAGRIGRRQAAILFLVAFAMLILTHTRTALVAMLVGLVIATLSLVAWHKRARRALLVFALIAIVVGGVFRPEVTAWATRGESTTELNDLTGRTIVWHTLETAPRTQREIYVGFGLSNAAFNGLPIDNSWLALYEELGLFGDIMAGLSFFVLLLLAAVKPRGPARAVAIFLIVYCFIASFTETGLGLPSPYLLDLSVAAALLVSPMASRPIPADAPMSVRGTRRRSGTRLRHAA